MNDASRPAVARPWYREPMLWLVVGLPFIVVVAGFVTLFVAIRAGGADAYPSEVRRTAQIQVESLAADQAAIARGIAGSLAIDPDTGGIRVVLENVPGDVVQVRLSLIHPARAEGDSELMLTRSGDAFHGRIATPLAQVWSVRVSDVEGGWRVGGRYEQGRRAVRLAPSLSEGR